jgi:hypothetical protein
MARTLTVSPSDADYSIPFTVKKKDGSAYNLTGHDVYFHISDKKYVNKLRGVCVLVVAGDGTCKYTLVAGDVNHEPGDYLGELKVTTPAGLVIRNVAKMTIKIVEECG